MVSTLGMLKNDIKRSISYNFHTKLNNTPHILVIESTNYCNLDCAMCPRRNMTRKLEHIDFDLFKKIVDESKDFAFDIGLDLFGEPLLCPNIFKMIKYAKQSGVTTSMSTNASFLTEENGKKILESGLDLLVIDFDGATKETYEKIRRGANYEIVLKNIQNFAKLVKNTNSKIYVLLQLIKMRETEPEISQWRVMWKDSPFHLYIKNFNTWSSQDIGIKELSDPKHRIRDNSRRYPCAWLWEQMIFSVNGDVVPCCADYDTKLNMGNVKNKSVLEIWNGEAYTKLRNNHLNKIYPSICKDCLEWKGHPRFMFWKDMKFLKKLAIQ